MYIDALLRKDEGKISVVERVKGMRQYKEYDADYSFYVIDSRGKYTSIFGDKLSKVTPASSKDAKMMRANYGKGKTFESDANVVMRCLEQNYLNAEPPNMHVAFFDIETAFDADIGYSSAEDALNPITSISVYLQWMDQMVCLAVPPPTITWEEAQEMIVDLPEVVLFRTEVEMLDVFLNLIEDADLLSGWNSETYDIPYTVNRVIMLMGRNEARRFCLWDQMPKRRTIERAGAEIQSYDIIGRVHLDYLQLYKKYTYEQKPSYSLDSISEIELGEKKVPYNGTLDQLYKKDFKKFLQYNIQDTRLLDKLDKKLQYVYLANSIAHANSVLIPATMGTVALVDQAITIEAHRRNMIVPDRKHNVDFDDYFTANESEEESSTSDQAAGGWVCCHKPGLHKWVGSSDLNSLYPSVFRAFNMSPETLIGQIRTDRTDKAISDYILEARRNTFSDWWNDRFSTLEMEEFLNNTKDVPLWLDLENGGSMQITGAELRKIIFESGEPWCITANGTIFRFDIEGVIPSLFSRWYAERKQLQSVMRKFSSINAGSTRIPDRLK